MEVESDCDLRDAGFRLHSEKNGTNCGIRRAPLLRAVNDHRRRLTIVGTNPQRHHEPRRRGKNER